MKAVHGQFAFLLFAASAFAFAASGCAVGGKSFSMDSNSRVPFFGLELRERKPKSGAPAYSSISRTGIDKSRVEAAVGNTSTTSFELLKQGDKRFASAKVTGGDSPPESNAAPIKTAKSPTAQAIPLPRTDNQPGPSERHAEAATIDFQ